MGRILYTLDHKTIVSKDRGLQYLSERSAEEWELLLKEVARIRHNPKEKRMLSRWRRADMTKRYLLHLIETCREMVGKKMDNTVGVLSFLMFYLVYSG